MLEWMDELFAWGENENEAMRGRLSHESVGKDVMGCVAKDGGLKTGRTSGKGKEGKEERRKREFCSHREEPWHMHSCMHAVWSSSGDRKA